VTRRSSRPDSGTRFIDEVGAVQNAVDELTAQGVARIILLSHYGFENELALAREVTDLDIIVGGHSHTLLGEFRTYGLHSTGPYPAVTRNADGDPVCVVQAWEHGYVLGELNVTFEGDKLSSWSGTPHLVLGKTFTRETDGGETFTLAGDALSRIIDIAKADPKLDMPAEDAVIAAIISKYAGKVDTYKQTVIGKSGEDLPHIRIPGTHSNGTPLPLGSDIAPLVARAFYKQAPYADICIQNAGGIRTDLGAGDISYSTAYEMLPFSNTLFEIEMTGAQIHQALENALAYLLKTGATGAFPYAYALKYDVDATGPYGSRVRNLEIKDRNSGIYSPIMEDFRYVVVTSDYLAEGRDGYDTFAEVLKQGAKGTDTQIDYTQAFVNHLKELTAAGRPLEKLPAEDHCIKHFTPYHM
jgi:5'-nucleotidase